MGVPEREFGVLATREKWASLIDGCSRRVWEAFVGEMDGHKQDS